MRRTITSLGGDSEVELSQFTPSVVARHPKYDYVLGTELKHGTNSLERGLDIKYHPGSVSYTHLTLPTTPYV